MKLRPILNLMPSPAHAGLASWSRSTERVRGVIAVAYSGGADSTALLIEEARMRLALMHGGYDDAQRRNRHPLLALHVHHGLQPAADGFVAHCRAFCDALNAQWPTTLCVAHATVALPAGASVEAQAREARYDALATLAQEYGVGTVLLAQHADDQIESVLIALSRGAGVAGLSGMAPEFVHCGVHFARPMLDAAADDIRAWLATSETPHIEDPSNDNQRFTRNRIRKHVLPILNQTFPALRSTLARSARLAAAAHALMEDVAAEDLTRVGSPPQIARLQALSAPRCVNVLRHWLKSTQQTTGSEAQMLELVNVIQACVTRAHGIHIRVGRGVVGRHGDHLTFDAFL